MVCADLMCVGGDAAFLEKSQAKNFPMTRCSVLTGRFLVWLCQLQGILLTACSLRLWKTHYGYTFRLYLWVRCRGLLADHQKIVSELMGTAETPFAVAGSRLRDIVTEIVSHPGSRAPWSQLFYYYLFHIISYLSRRRTRAHARRGGSTMILYYFLVFLLFGSVNLSLIC